MKKITVKFGGKTWTEVEANNSGWIAPGADKELVELLKAAPRAAYTSKGVPIVKSDDGTNIYLGAAELRNEGESIHASDGSGTKSSSPKIPQVPLSVIEDVLAQKGLSKETRELFEAMKKDAEEAQKAKMEKAKNLLSGFSKAELEALKAILG
jgi:hypothetical protein